MEALESGLDIAAGMHNLLNNEKELVSLAESLGRRLIDVRVPTFNYQIANGKNRKVNDVLQLEQIVQLEKCIHL